jgi:hypothetical protein
MRSKFSLPFSACMWQGILMEPNAEFYNSQINATGLPLENEETINGVQIKYDLFGKDSIASQFSNFLYIAQQCPYSGGAAVFQARWYVHKFINDSIEYDDKATCLTQGIYRLPSNTSLFTLNKNIDFSIAPNPNNGVFKVDQPFIEPGFSFHFSMTA